MKHVSTFIICPTPPFQWKSMGPGSAREEKNAREFFSKLSSIIRYANSIEDTERETQDAPIWYIPISKILMWCTPKTSRSLEAFIISLKHIWAGGLQRRGNVEACFKAASTDHDTLAGRYQQSALLLASPHRDGRPYYSHLYSIMPSVQVFGASSHLLRTRRRDDGGCNEVHSN